MPTYAVIGNDRERADAVARATGGTAYLAVDESAARDDVPFRTLVVADVADPSALAGADEIGTYRVHVRVIRPLADPPPAGTTTEGVVAVFGMRRHPDLTHEQADAHWRDVHAPLALHHHVGMWHYEQCSVDEVVRGPAYDGFALCAFASLDDLRDRFYDGPEGRVAIGADVASFADTAASPRRVICSETVNRR